MPEENQELDLKTRAEEPLRVRADGVDIWQHPLKDQIEADKYLATRKHSSNPFGALRFAKIELGGSTAQLRTKT